MALDTTVAGAAADSYLSVADADALANADLGTEATRWLAADAPTKEKALRRATREVDGYLRSSWSPYAVGQALLFPRTIDRSGSPAVPLIPRRVQLATYEQATYVLANADVLDAAATRRARGLSSATEPNVSYSESTDVEIGVMSPAAIAYLDAYATSGSGRRGGLRSVRTSVGLPAGVTYPGVVALPIETNG